MALSRLSLAFSLLLLSLLVIASAGDVSSKYGFDGIPAESPQAKPEADNSSKYGFDGIPADSPQAKPDDSSKYGFDGIPADSPQAKPEGEEKPHYYTKPVDKEKPDYDKKLEAYKPKPGPNYGTKQDIYKPKPEEKSEEKEKPDYDRKPYVVKPKPEEEKHYYGTKPDNYKAKPEENPDYDRKPYVVKPEPKGEEKPYYGTKPEEKENRLSIAVQGLVLCKSGSKYYPIKGAFATITCKAVDEVGVEKTVSLCSEATDEKGYFFATLSHLRRDKLKLKECKAYLKSSPLQTCNVPTNVNKAIEGSLLSGFRVLPEKKMKLYSVRPFFYTSEAKAAPEYGY
ncbi:hypothetical protein REPUB_Repub17cG0115200 [Reevesia pubescens]